MSIAAGLAAERTYFQTHEVYGRLADRMGVSFLAQRLSDLLVKHIKATLPALNQEVCHLGGWG